MGGGGWGIILGVWGWMGHHFRWMEVSVSGWGIILGGWGRLGKHFGRVGVGGGDNAPV